MNGCTAGAWKTTPPIDLGHRVGHHVGAASSRDGAHRNLSPARLKSRYAEILSTTGFVLALSGFLILTPLLCLLAWPEESIDWQGFVWPALLLSGMGMVLRWAFRRPTAATLSVQEGGVVVLLSWVIVILFSAWPLMAVQKLNFTQAVFEAVSGWTTTGLSVVDVAKASHLVLLWRSNMQLAGARGSPSSCWRPSRGRSAPGSPWRKAGAIN